MKYRTFRGPRAVLDVLFAILIILLLYGAYSFAAPVITFVLANWKIIMTLPLFWAVSHYCIGILDRGVSETDSEFTDTCACGFKFADIFTRWLHLRKCLPSKIKDVEQASN